VSLKISDEDLMWWWTDGQKDLIKDFNQFIDENREEAQIYYWKNEIPFPLLDKLADKGYFGAAIPKQYGGLELGTTGCCIVSEQMARLGYAGNIFVSSMIGGCRQLLKYGSEEQKQKWLPQIAKGKVKGAVCITEAYAGSDAANVQTTAVKDGNDWILNGKKRFISGGDIAGRFFVYAKTSDDPDDRKNYSHLSAFFVERGTPGFSLERVNEILGLGISSNVYLSFNDVRIPDENRVGAIGKGWNIMMAGLNFERLINNTAMLGTVQDLVQLLFYYTRRRVQFNRPTSRIPRIQDLIAEILSTYRMARVFNYNCAKQMDDGLEPTIDVSIAKWIPAEFLRDLALKAIQVMGGDGVMKYYPVGGILIGAKINEIAAGSTEVQKMIIYRFSSRKYNKPFRMRWIDEVNGSIVSNKDSRFKGLEINEENVLKVIAHDYKVNPALYMTPDDVRQDIGGGKTELLKTFTKLEEQKLIAVHRDRAGKISLVKASYEGLKKAFPEDYYRWFPSWTPDSIKF